MRILIRFMYKITFQIPFAIFCGLLFLIISNPANGQPKLNKYGLPVITTIKDYKSTLLKDNDKAMVDVISIPSVQIDLPYTRKDNFMKKILYQKTNTTYLRKPVLMALIEVQTELRDKGLGLKIWDGYRPFSVTEKIWHAVKDERYAANPANGSGHNRGISVDLSLIILTTKEAVNMGTSFDHFSDSAHQSFQFLPAKVLLNRLLLKTTMEKYGFISLETEWWHYAFADAKKYELLDLSFRALSKLQE